MLEAPIASVTYTHEDVGEYANRAYIRRAEYIDVEPPGICIEIDDTEVLFGSLSMVVLDSPRYTGYLKNNMNHFHHALPLFITLQYSWHNMAFEVTCVTTDSSSTYNDCRCIETIGYDVSGSTFTKTPAQMYEKIKGGTDFYVEHYGSKTNLEAVKRGSTKYVRTESNDTSSDNLLEQPSC
ncbi:DUF3892 domain-containing protein [Natronococcus jeotgali]|uniref:DUF3892 domain-containing protein n=1 Tax=Natronococcus jeotgali TaxID=413812 RepID=UPI00126883AC|nr:DUF3892 domain-containing protein [Natronococcus jeotgali]